MCEMLRAGVLYCVALSGMAHGDNNNVGRALECLHLLASSQSSVGCCVLIHGCLAVLVCVQCSPQSSVRGLISRVLGPDYVDVCSVYCAMQNTERW